MTGRKAIVGVCILCALIFSAFAAQTASAATNGTTAYTCKPVNNEPIGTKGFSDAHCKVAVENTLAEPNVVQFKHIAIAELTTTEIIGSNETTGGARETVSLTSTQAGIAEEITAKKVSGTGSMHNALNGAGEHVATGTGTLVYEEVEVTKPAGKGCKVTGGKVTTKELAATTEGQGMFLKFTPKAGTTFAEFSIEGCTGSKAIESLNGAYTVTGSVKGVPNGATTVTTGTETTAQETLFLREQKAGINGPLTIKGRDNSLEAYTPLSVTTVSTP